jgi:DNA-binding transcriptional MerR regulator
MSYTVHQLAQLANVSVRTLHHYDAIGLLHSGRNAKNQYRIYEEADLLKLQQILFFRELDFKLEDIQAILESPNFDMASALGEHKQMILVRRKRLDELVKTIDKTIKKINKENTMEDKELYEGFSKEEMEAWNKEAEERWGNTDAYKQSKGKYESLTREQKLAMKKAGEDLMEEIVANMGKGAASPEVQALVQRHYDNLRFFYEPNPKLYRGLADMYIGYQGDVRFRAYFEKHHKDLPEFMHNAMIIFVDAMEK